MPQPSWKSSLCDILNEKLTGLKESTWYSSQDRQKDGQTWTLSNARSVLSKLWPTMMAQQSWKNTCVWNFDLDLHPVTKTYCLWHWKVGLRLKFCIFDLDLFDLDLWPWPWPWPWPFPRTTFSDIMLKTGTFTFLTLMTLTFDLWLTFKFVWNMMVPQVC